VEGERPVPLLATDIFTPNDFPEYTYVERGGESLAIAQDPPTTDLPYTELMKRVERVCVNGAPVGSSVKEACMQIARFALDMYPAQRIVEFDEETGTDTLSIVDPYWLFYLRSSTKLASLAKRPT
jgi:hypothetical protein